jgi:CDP-diglyceride synthetase
MLAVCVPYWFVANRGYCSHYSMHLLPLAILSLMIVGDYFFKRFLKVKKCPHFFGSEIKK